MKKMSKTRKRLTFAFVVAAALLLVTVYAFADTVQPGSENDPVVTQSYVDAKIQALKDSQGSGSVGFQTKELTAGQKLIGKEGTQIILRSGDAKVIGNAANGISDITIGKDVMNGAAVSTNHLLLIPRDDGRGITAVSDIWVMVSGGYTVQ